MNKLQAIAAVLLTSATMVTMAQTSATINPPAPVTQGDGTPLTKKQLKEQKKQQKHQEKAAEEAAKAQKASADALKHQNAAKNEQAQITPQQ